MSSDPVVISSYARTPMGGFQGALAAVKSTDLGAAAVQAALTRAPSTLELEITLAWIRPNRRSTQSLYREFLKKSAAGLSRFVA